MTSLSDVRFDRNVMHSVDGRGGRKGERVPFASKSNNFYFFDPLRICFLRPSLVVVGGRRFYARAIKTKRSLCVLSLVFPPEESITIGKYGISAASK